MVIVDEAHNFITPAIAKGMTMARANRGSYVLAVQDLAQVTDPTLRENLFSVAGNKVVMAGAGEQDTQKFSAIFGQQEREYRSTSTSASTGTTRSSSRGQGGGGGLLGSSNGVHHQTSRATGNASTETAGTSRTFRLRPTFLPAERRFLPPFHAVIERRSNTGEITPATVVHLDRALVEAVADATRPPACRVAGEALAMVLIPGGAIRDHRSGGAVPRCHGGAGVSGYSAV